MMNAKFLGQYEIREGYQAIFWYIFLIDATSDSLESSANDFICSESFRENCLPFIIKKKPKEGSRFLQRAFNQDSLNISDFRILTKEDVLLFFSDYATSDGWNDDREDFITLMNGFNEIFKEEPTDHFFLISKEWFDKGNKILSADSEFYIYYFLMVWFDTDKKIINICEWVYD